MLTFLLNFIWGVEGDTISRTQTLLCTQELLLQGLRGPCEMLGMELGSVV